MRKVIVATVFALPTALISMPADACLHGVQEEVNWRVRVLVRAEKNLRRGRYARAAKFALRAYPGIRRVKAFKRSRRARLVRRAARLMAMAAIRKNGKLRMGSLWKGRTKAQRLDNLRWSTAILQQLIKRRPNDPQLKTNLAEGLARIPGQQDAAYEILAKLGKRDLVAGAHGYATLARLRKQRGDDAGALAAVRRCRKMTRNAKICRQAPIKIAMIN